jgi:apoptosis-inducing factor 3
VNVENGDILVTADPAQTKPEGKARPPKVTTNQEEPGPGVVVVGGGSGAYGVIESLREFGYKKSITVVSREHYAPIDRYAFALK